MKTKIALLGIMGHGKSSVGNLLIGKDCFKVSNDIYSCTPMIEPYDNGNLVIFDTRGLNDKGETDVNNLQDMIKTFKKEKLNAIFIVFNGQVCRFDEGMKQIIREICKLFMGKYIWKQIGIIFTRYGYEEEQQDEIRERSKNFVKEILKVAEEEYKEIIKKQDDNNKTCDPNEKITDNLKCFFVNAKRKRNGQYDPQTLEEIEKIKNLAKNYPPINKVQSKFIVKKDTKKDIKGDFSKINIEKKEEGFIAGLKTVGYYMLGALNVLETPAWLLGAGACKLIGLPFDDDSFVNELGDDYVNLAKATPKFFKEIPDKANTKIVGCEVHYNLYDLELTYWSDKSITRKIFNVRPVVE